MDDEQSEKTIALDWALYVGKNLMVLVEAFFPPITSSSLWSMIAYIMPFSLLRYQKRRASSFILFLLCSWQKEEQVRGIKKSFPQKDILFTVSLFPPWSFGCCFSTFWTWFGNAFRCSDWSIVDWHHVVGCTCQYFLTDTRGRDGWVRKMMMTTNDEKGRQGLLWWGQQDM